MAKNNELQVASIKELLAEGVSEEEVVKICDELYMMTDFICEDYPKHKSWFYQKHLPATLTPGSGRDVIFAYDKQGTTHGTAFIKEDETEKKLGFLGWTAIVVISISSILIIQLFKFSSEITVIA